MDFPVNTPLRYGPATQPYAHADNYPGEPTRDPISRVLYKIGQEGPLTEEDWNMAHGRHLAGLGGENETQAPWDTDYKTDALRELEKDDDVYGSGIFDTYGRQGTINPDMGVFADHPSLPGFIDREVTYAVSKDIYDITSGADVVTVAGGGMTYQERGGLPYPFQGRAPCPPARGLPPATPIDQVYVSLSPTKAPPPQPKVDGHYDLLPPPAPAPWTPNVPVPMAVPGVGTKFSQVPYATQEIPLPLKPINPSLGPRGIVPTPQLVPGTPFSRVPVAVPQLRLGTRSIVNMGVESVPAKQAYAPRQLPMSYTAMPVGMRSIATTGDSIQRVAAPPLPRVQAPSKQAQAPGASRLKLRAVGAATEPESSGWMTYAFAGLLVGGAAAMFIGATKIKTKR